MQYTYGQLRMNIQGYQPEIHIATQCNLTDQSMSASPPGLLLSSIFLPLQLTALQQFNVHFKTVNVSILYYFKKPRKSETP